MKIWQHWFPGERWTRWPGQTWEGLHSVYHSYQICKHVNVLLSPNILTIKYKHQNYIISIHNLNDFWTKRKLNVLFCLNIYWVNIKRSKMQFWHFEKCVADNNTRNEYVGTKSRKCFNIRTYFSKNSQFMKNPEGSQIAQSSKGKTVVKDATSASSSLFIQKFTFFLLQTPSFVCDLFLIINLHWEWFLSIVPSLYTTLSSPCLCLANPGHYFEPTLLNN